MTDMLPSKDEGPVHPCAPVVPLETPPSPS